MSKPPLPAGETPSPRHKTRSQREHRPSQNNGKVGSVPEKTLKDLMRSYDLSSISIISKEFHTSSDRSSAILLSAFVERMLELNITLRLPRRDEASLDRLTGRDGPLNSLFSTTQLAYAMGIISYDVRNELDCIRKVRNVFAHSAMDVDFTTPAISNECKKLERLSKIIEMKSQLSEDETVKAFLALSKPRAQYSMACMLLWVYLLARILPDGYFEKQDNISNTFKTMFKYLQERLSIPIAGKLA
jgi:hypothetical protein